MPIFFNEEAGRSGERAVRALRDELAVAGVATRLAAVPAESLGEAVSREASGGARVVVVAGGDGSVSTAAGALAGRATALGVLPAGTLNHFASRLGIDGPRSAARALVAGRVAEVAVGRVNGRHFVNNASCGVYAHMLRHRRSWRRWLTKWPAAALAWTAVVARSPMLDVVLEVDAGRIERLTPIVWVGIGRSSFRLPEVGRTGERARELEVVVADAGTRRALMALTARGLWRLARGRHPAGDPALDAVHAPRIRLESAERVDVALDGELVRLEPPLEFRIEERVLRVLTPLPG